MAAAIKYQLSFRDHFNQRVVLEIYAKDWTGGITSLVGAKNPLTLEWKGDESNITQTMIPSELSVSIVASKTSLVMSDLLTAKDSEYFCRLRVLDTDGLTILYLWQGFIISDQIKHSFNYNEDIISFKFVDCLTISKSITISPEPPYFGLGLNTIEALIQSFWDKTGWGEEWATLDVEEVTNLSLSRDYNTGIKGAFKLYSETFQDSEGRMGNYWDAFERIFSGFNLRAFYDNGKLHLVDLLAMPLISTILPEKKITYKAHASTDELTDIVLLGNSELVNKTKIVNETKCVFKYDNIIGMLPNGLFRYWTPVTGGYVPRDWQLNSTIMASDYYNRRVGTGRAEAPYAFRMESDDRIASRMDALYGNKYKVDIETRFQGIEYYISGVKQRVLEVVLYTEIIAFNKQNPAKSFALRPIYNAFDVPPRWYPTNLSGTSFESGDYDFGALVPTYQYYARAEPHEDIQTVSIDLPSIPQFAPGEDEFDLWVCLRRGFGYSKVADDTDPLPDDPAEPDDYNVYLRAFHSKVLVTRITDASGEVVYLTRDSDSNTKGETKEIGINTSTRDEAAGSLYSAIPFTDGIFIHYANEPLKILSRAGEPLLQGIKLVEMIAASEMWLKSVPQNIIDVEGRTRLFRFAYQLDMDRFYDSSKPFTDIYYNAQFVPQVAKYSFKTNQVQMTMISVDISRRGLDWDNEPTSTRDFIEFYLTQK